MRYLLLLIALVVLIISVVLLLDFTASNPTGRRFSSGTVDLSLSNQEKGRQGEQIVAEDLGIPSNDTGARACLCHTPNPSPVACNSCFAQVEQLTQDRRPDFITAKYIVEVKNHQNLLYNSGRDWQEIGDYAIGARELAIPLWVFVRTDTEVAPQLDALVESTGGQVVHYLAVPGYVDRVGQVAKVSAAISLIVLLAVLFRPSGSRPSPDPAPPKSATDDLEDFVARVKAKKRLEIDIEDSRPE